MKILFLAPHPYYQDRGTPIAVRMLLQYLSGRGYQIDVLTYHEGADVVFPNVTIYRIPRIPGIQGITPGFSIKKLLCDAVLFFKAWRMAAGQEYDLLHAVEESAFAACLISWRFGIPFVFDMDSSLPQQLVEKHPYMKVMFPWFQRWEAFAIRRALAIVPVCDALADIGRRAGARKIFVLRDISLLEQGQSLPSEENLRESLPLRGVCFMYIGNLEVYQGIDLLLDSFAVLHKEGAEASLVIVGGAFRDIQFYQEKAGRLGIEKNVHFLGPRPVNQMGALIKNADVLVSPRIKGHNTPMKIYSYLDSGRPILATDLFTHTQVLTPDVAVLEPPIPERFAQGMRKLTRNPELRNALACKAQNLARKKYCLSVYLKTAGDLYDYIDTQVAVKERLQRVQGIDCIERSL